MFNLFINNKKMKKTTVTRAYEAPVVNVESINVEKGFALSGSGIGGGDHWEMQPIILKLRQLKSAQIKEL